MKGFIRTIILLLSLFLTMSVCSYAGELVDYTAPDGVKYRVDYDNGVKAYCIDKNITQADIPSSINGYPVTFVDFSNCRSLAYAEIPEGITGFSFSGCTTLNKVTIPSSVTSISENAFYSCSSLEYIELPEALNMIRDNAFNGCTELKSIVIPEGVTSISGNAFSDCSSLSEIDLPDSVTYVGVGVFSGCSSLTSINLPEGISSIEANTFLNCSSLASITVPGSVTEIKESAFEGCAALKSIDLAGNITSIRDDAFNGCSSLKSVTLPDKLEYIGWAAFRDCKRLKTITIPGSVTVIKASAFSGCTNLTVTIPAGVVSIGGYDYITADFAPFYRVKSAKYEGNSTEAIKSAISPYSKKITSGSITLKWTEFTKASAYKIYKYNNSTKRWQLLKTIKDTQTTSYKVKNLKSNKKYLFKVKVIVDGKSYENKLRGQYTYRIKPSKINSVQLYTGNKSIKSIWSSSKRAAGYQVQIASNKKFTKGVKTKTYYRSNAYSAKFKNLKKGSRYYVRVRAFNDRSRNEGDNAAQYGKWSKTVSIRCR